MNVIKAYIGTSLILRILAGVVIGTLLAMFLPGYDGMAILGDLFVGALKGIAPVLVAVLVASAIAKSGSGLSSRFNTVITLYLFTTLLAAIFAVFASHFFPVGISVDNVASAEGAAPGALNEVFRKILKDI